MRWRLLGRNAPIDGTGNAAGSIDMFPVELDTAIDNAVRLFRDAPKPNSGKR